MKHAIQIITLLVALLSMGCASEAITREEAPLPAEEPTPAAGTTMLNGDTCLVRNTERNVTAFLQWATFSDDTMWVSCQMVGEDRGISGSHLSSAQDNPSCVMYGPPSLGFDFEVTHDTTRDVLLDAEGEELGACEP